MFVSGVLSIPRSWGGIWVIRYVSVEREGFENVD
jgi:hypothetical protein